MSIPIVGWFEMEDRLKGRRPHSKITHRKMTSREDDFTGRRPHKKTVSNCPSDEKHLFISSESLNYFKDMAQVKQNVCTFNKYGFCRFRSNCRKQHLMEICSNKDCEIKECSLRHPKTCRYFRDIGFCKFGEWWLFNHNEENLKEIKQITKKNENKN